MRVTRTLGLAVLALAATVAPAAAHAPDGAVGGRAVAPADDKAAMIAARQRFFGEENVNPRTGAVRRDRAIFSWFGVTNFALAIRGHVLLLDAWVARGAHSGYVPTTPEELAALRPSHILIGHAHFDHAADAVPIAEASGATLVGLGEHCEELTARSTAPTPPRCEPIVPAGAGFGARGELKILKDVELVAVKHLHSGGESPDGSDAGGYHVPVLPMPTTTVLDHPPRPADVAHLVEHAPDAEGGSVLYRFRAGGRSFVWHDTSGPLKENAPETFDAFRALRPVDVELGAIQGFNQLTNGMRDPRMYIEAFAPKLFVPTHHDDWLPGITTTADGYEDAFYGELGRMPAEQRPTVRFIRDPDDYLRPQSLSFALARR
jgi:L-ascorbate metabolism protein UlaG (beta-lactamase superfamily)